MKKLFFVVALLAVVASCTKNEVIPQNDGNKEITYLTAPLTKATTYGTDNKFYSFAYLVQGYGSNWADNSSTAATFIDHALISYNDNKWKAATAYYWPKDANSKLTFFAWGDGTPAPALTMGDCSNTTGIVFVDYNVAVTKNKDLMVAKIAADQKSNTTSVNPPYGQDGVTQGVPTLFYHVLSSLVIQAKTDKAYADYTFKVKSITFNDVCVKGTYVQGVNTQYLPTGAPVLGGGAYNDVWTADVGTAETLNLYTASDADGTLIVNDGSSNTTPLDNTNSTGSEYTIMLPHTLADYETVTIVYTVHNGSALEEVKNTVKLNTIFTEGWLPGKKYTLTITLSLNEILWDPAVEVWDTGTSYSWSM